MAQTLALYAKTTQVQALIKTSSETMMKTLDDLRNATAITDQEIAKL